jgi:hypothetical protein
LVAIGKSLMSQQNSALQELGLHIIEGISGVPTDDQAEIVHLLIGIAASASELSSRAVEQLGGLSTSELSSEAKVEIDQWLSSNV